MPYDEGLAQRVRETVERRKGVAERKMFGGLCFLVNGNMACGVTHDDLMVRVGPDAHAEALALPHARKMDFTGRPMKGFVFVSASGLEADDDLKAWIDRGFAYAKTFPTK
jgi:TfoX/Sxy family transcriptional regulator of competence genes